MPEVKQVTAIVSNPVRDGDLGRVTTGFYVLADGVLTMTDGDGKPVRRLGSGEVYRQKVAEGDEADVIAKRLTLQIHRSAAGREGVAGFNGPLQFNNAGIA